MSDLDNSGNGGPMSDLGADTAMRRDSVRLQLRLWTEGLVDGRLDFHNCSNLSVGGIFIEFGEPYDIGKTVQIEFNLPGVFDPIKVTGRVVSRIAGVPDDAPKGNGFKFIDLSDPDRHLIETFIETSIEEESIF